jgi:hypothetical protein
LAQVAKKHSWQILLVILLLASNLQAKPQVIDWKVLSDTSLNGADLFIDKDNRVFIEAASHYLWLNNNQIKTDQYGEYLNGFVRDGCVHLAFLKEKQNVDIYTVGKDIKLENRIAIGDFPRGSPVQVISVSGDNNTYCVLGSRTQSPWNPVKFMVNIKPDGGLYYDKPVLAEGRGQTLLKYFKIPYGGKIDESYIVKEVLTGKDKVCFFGFRTQDQYRNWPTSEILHFAEYNMKKKKVVQSQDIYEELPDFNKSDKPRTRNLYLELSSYWHISADSLNDDLFIVFSWHGFRFSKIVNGVVPRINMENINSPIYYSQSSGGTFGDVKMIGEGILPLVRADSLGNVHVIWSNSNGDLVHKVKKGDKWGKEQIILDNVIDTKEIWESWPQERLQLQKICAEFDKDNNLNLVFTSNGNLVYAKVKVD